MIRMVEQLKENTRKFVKIEMAPWTKSVTPDTKDLRFNLKKREQGNERTESFSDCEDLFAEEDDEESDEDDDDRNVTDVYERLKTAFAQRNNVTRERGAKVLIRGGRDVGKTTLVRKIALDWANGTFTRFSIVFLVSLKQMKREQSIERAMLQQTGLDKLEDLTKEKLRYVLETVGSECLVIFDGLDESDCSDVTAGVKGQKLFFCNVLFTSREANVANTPEQFFTSTYDLTGFSSDYTEWYLAKFVTDQSKVDAIQECEIEVLGDPLRLTFLSLLVNEGNLVFDGETKSQTDIYFCLLRNVVFNDLREDAFLRKVKAIGKVAFETMLKGNDLLSSDDSNLGLHESFFADGLLLKYAEQFMFPHPTLQVFLAALFYILSQDDKGEDLSHGDGMLFSNHLFLYYCLGIPCLQELVSKDKKDKILGDVVEKVLNKIDLQQLDLADVLSENPAFRLQSGAISKFLKEDVFPKLKRTEELVLGSRHLFGEVVPFLISGLKAVHLGDSRRPILAELVDSLREEVLSVFVHNEASQQVEELLDLASQSGREFALYFVLGPGNMSVLDLSHLLKWKGLQKLKILQKQGSTDIVCSEIPLCETLQELSFTASGASGSFDENITVALVEAAQKGHLPHLKSLNVKTWNIRYCQDTQAADLLRTSWPAVTNLSTKGHIRAGDAFFHSFPKLTSLTLTHESALSFKSKTHNCPKKCAEQGKGQLKTLRIERDVDKQMSQEIKGGTFASLQTLEIFDYSQGTELDALIFADGKLPHLRKLKVSSRVRTDLGSSLNTGAFPKVSQLDFSHCSPCRYLALLLYEKRLQSLTRLCLSDCELNDKDMKSLAQADVEGWLPLLLHLDITDNDCWFSGIECLFYAGARWNKLTHFFVNQEKEAGYHHSRDQGAGCSLQFLTGKSQDGCLESVQELRFSTKSPSDLRLLRTNPKCWPHLQTIQVLYQNSEHTPVSLNVLDVYSGALLLSGKPNPDPKSGRVKARTLGDVLDPIAEATYHGAFPALHTVRACLVTQGNPQARVSTAHLQRQALRRKGVSVYFLQKSGI